MPLIVNNKTVVHKGSQGYIEVKDPCYDRKRRVVNYTNKAYSKDAKKTAVGIFINGHPVCNKNSIFAKSYGDEEGVNGGVHSGTIQGPAHFVSHQEGVFFDGAEAVCEGDLMVSNNGNTQPTPVIQPGVPAPALNPKIQWQKPEKNAEAYRLDFDLGYLQPESLCDLIRAYPLQGDDDQGIPLGREGDASANQVTRQASIFHLTQPEYLLRLELASQSGDSIELPLSSDPVTAQAAMAAGPAAGEAPNVLMPVQLKWHTQLAGALAPRPNDYTAIQHYDQTLRLKINLQLDKVESKTLQKQPWTESIDADLNSQIALALEPEHASNLRQGGWVYVFKDGYLWRELFIDRVHKTPNISQLSEVDLAKNAGIDDRKPSGENEKLLTLPYKINGKIPKLEIAYSEIQWSWARINYFGGMDPRDIRLEKIKRPIALLSRKEIARAAQHRQQRVEGIDLGPFTQTGVKLGCKNDNVHLLDKNKVPTLFVADPMGLIARTQLDLLEANLQLKKCMEDITHEPYFHSALLTYQTFFNPNVAFDQGITKKEYDAYETHGGDLLNTMGDSGMPPKEPNVFKRAQKDLDKNKLESILKVKKRRHLRRRIRRLQQTLVMFCQDPDAAADILHYANPINQEDKPEMTNANNLKPLIYNYQGVNFTTAFKDYFSASKQNYPQAFIVLGSLLASMSVDPGVMDYKFDIQRDYDPQRMLSGNAYALSIFNSQHSLYRCIFPTQAQLDLVSSLKAKHRLRFEKDKNQGGGEFRMMAFIAAIVRDGSLVLESAAEALKHMMNAVGAGVRKAKPEFIPHVQQRIYSLVRMTHIEILDSMELVSLDNVMNKTHIMGLDVIQTMPLHNTDTTEEFNYRGPDGVTIKTVEKAMDDPNAQATIETIGRASPGIVNEFHGVDTGPAKTIENITDNIAAEMAGPTGKVFSWSPKVKVIDLMQVDRALSSIIMGLAMFNVGLAVVNLSEKRDRHNTLELFSSVFALGYAIENFTTAWYGFDNVLNVYSKSKLTFDFLKFQINDFRLLVTPLAMLGIAGGFIEAFQGVSSLIDDLKAHNDGAAMGDEFQFSGGVLSVLSILGDGAKKSVENAPEFIEAAVEGESGELVSAVIDLSWLELFGPFGWLAAILMLTGDVISYFCHDGPLEKWAKASPFAKQHKKPLTNTVTYESLLTLLVMPQVELTKLLMQNHSHPYHVYFTVKLPYFVKRTAFLDTELFSQIWEMERVATHAEPVIYNAPIYETVPNEKLSLNTATPVEIMQYIDPESRKVYKIIYHYGLQKPADELLKPHGLNQFYQIIFQSRSSLYFANGQYRVPTRIAANLDQPQVEHTDSIYAQDPEGSGVTYLNTNQVAFKL